MTAAPNATDAAPRGYLAAEVWLKTMSGLVSPIAAAIATKHTTGRPKRSNSDRSRKR